MGRTVGCDCRDGLRGGSLTLARSGQLEIRIIDGKGAGGRGGRRTLQFVYGEF